MFAGLPAKLEEVSLKDIAAGSSAVAAIFERAVAAAAAAGDDAQPTVIICDGATQDHMEVVTEALEELAAMDVVLCGSQGLATALASSDAVWTGAGEKWAKVQPGPIVIASTSHQKAVKVRH